MVHAMSSMPNSLPETIGPYRLCGLLGEGGMSTVYLAERVEDFTQRVAIKIVDRPGLLAAAEAGSEERVLVSLNHDAIVRLIDWGTTTRGFRYFVMEYVEGVPLDVFCEGHPHTPQAKVELVLQVADAVAHAHQRLVVHCDLKPSNILVTPDGRVKLLDFGVAQLLGMATRRRSSAEAAGYTDSYASPEQVAGTRVNVTTDVYALGVIARRLIEAAGSMQGGPSARALRSAVKNDPDLDAVLRRATETQAELRYRSMEAFAGDLRRYLAGRPVEARRGGAWVHLRSWTYRHKTAAATCAFLWIILAASGAIVIRESLHAARQRRDAQMHLHDLVQMTGDLDGALYDSALPLPHSDAARAVLVDQTRTTLKRLAEDDGRDPVLSLEIARQYEHAAQLELKSGEPGDAQRERARESLESGLSLLEKIPPNDPVSAESRREQTRFRAQLLALPQP